MTFAHRAYTISYTVQDDAGEACAVAEQRGFEEYELIDASTAPEGAQLALTLTDDCMLPYFPQGGRVYVRCSEMPEEFGAGVFMYRGRILCRQWCEDYSGALHLLAANPARQGESLRIPAAERGELVCLGRVIYATALPRPSYE